MVRRSEQGTVVIAGACDVSTLTLKSGKQPLVSIFIHFFLTFQQNKFRKGYGKDNLMSTSLIRLTAENNI